MSTSTQSPGASTTPTPPVDGTRERDDVTTQPTLRTARATDLPPIERLLAEAGLPTVGVDELLAAHADDVVVAEDASAPGEIVGVAGLEVRGEDALLRSVAVRPAWRSHRLGEALVRTLVEQAEARQLRALYLLTTTAERWFPRFGFAPIAREAAPAGIAATLEFRSACPASAVAMMKLLQR